MELIPLEAHTRRQGLLKVYCGPQKTPLLSSIRVSLTVSCDAANENASVVKIAKKLSDACDFEIAAARLRSTTSEELGKRLVKRFVDWPFLEKFNLFFGNDFKTQSPIGKAETALLGSRLPRIR